MSTSNGLVSFMCLSPLDAARGRRETWRGSAQKTLFPQKCGGIVPREENHAKTQFVDRSSSPLDIDYLAMNCASSFRGLHEAVINHGGNAKPEIITCPHEEIAVHMAQGYAKIEGKPMAMICHGVVGLQHASMAMYNAWCDRVPVIVMGGNIIEANKRGPGAEWVHAAIDPAAMVRLRPLEARASPNLWRMETSM